MPLDKIIEFAIVFLLGLWALAAFKEVRDNNFDDTPLCPHGYADWDDCPDCRH